MIRRALEARRSRAGVCLGLLLLAIVTVGPALLPGRSLLPTDVLRLFLPWRDPSHPPLNPLLGDPVLQVSTRMQLVASLRGGHLPLWNPSLMAGHPMLGDAQAAPFAPIPLLLDLLLGPLRAVAWIAVLELWLAGILMWAWMRSLGLRRPAASLVAVGWMLAAYTQLWRVYPTFLGTLMWLPGVALAWERSLEPGARRPSIACGGLMAGLALLGGQIQFAVLGALLLLTYGAGRVLALPSVFRRPALRSGLGIAGLGLCLGSLQLLPALRLAVETPRPRLDAVALRATALPLRQLTGMVAPWAFGDPRLGSYVGSQNVNEMASYLGALPLLLLLVLPLAWRDPRVRLFALLAAGSLLLATGLAPLALMARLPMLDRFGLMRWLSIWPMAGLPLAGLLLDRLLAGGVTSRAPERRLAFVTLAAGLGLAALALTGRLGPDGQQAIAATSLAASGALLAAIVWCPGRLRWLPSLVLAADLLAFGRGYSPVGDLDRAFTSTPLLEGLARDAAADGSRIASFQSSPIVLGPSVAPALGFEEIGGYTSTPRRSYLALLAALAEAPDNGALESNANMIAIGGASPLLLELLDIRFVLAPAPLDPVRREAAPRGGCQTWLRLGPGDTLSRGFRAQAGGLNAVDVELGDEVPVAVHLHAAADPGRHLAYGVTEAESGRRILYFAPIADSQGRDFELRLDLPDGADQPARVCGDARGRPAIGLWTTQPRLEPIGQQSGIFAHELVDRPGRAWLVPRAERVGDLAAALERVTGPGFDPRSFVVVEGAEGRSNDRPALPPETEAEASDGGRPSDATGPRFRRDGPNRRSVALPPGAAGWLVLSEAWAPGWSARVDGLPVPVLRADGGIQALPIAPGARRVELRYLPAAFVSAVALTLLGLAIALALCLGFPRRL